MKKPTPLRIRYFAQPEPKCKYQTFRMRVNRRWMTKEEALNPNVDTRKYSSKTNIQLKEYRENYKWEKVWYARFLEMFKVCWDEEKAIKDYVSEINIIGEGIKIILEYIWYATLFLIPIAIFLICVFSELDIFHNLNT